MKGRETTSLCPTCLARVDARIFQRDGRMFLGKHCPEHGYFEAMIWSDPQSYFEWEDQSLHAPPSLDGTGEACDCPYTCGLCSGHEGDTCTSIFHLTDRCNLSCPICFASSGEVGRNPAELQIHEIKAMFQHAVSKTCVPTVQLSGGEPTVRDDLPQIIALGKELGVRHIQVNTNGLRLASDPEYAACLAHAGCDLAYLQFDGTDDAIYRRLRGRDLLAVKQRAIQNCREAELGVLLVVTVCAGVNDGNLGDIVRFAKDNMPIVRGIHFQPLTQMGRFDDVHAVTFPDLFALLEEQTQGEVTVSAIVPRRKAAAHCSFSSVFFAGADGHLHPLSGNGPKHEVRHEGVDGFVVDAVEFAQRYWRGKSGDACCGDEGPCDSDDLARKLHDRTLAISGMHFQDANTIDLARTRGCCVHVMTPQGKSVPFCTYYLTSSEGKRLYGPEGCLVGRFGR